MTTAVAVALVLVEGEARRGVVATVTLDATVADLAAVVGDGAPLFRYERELPAHATLVDAGVQAGDEIGVGAPVPSEWRQLGHELRIIGGTGAGLRRRIDGNAVVLGRADDATVVIRDPRLSRRHLELRLADEGFSLRDLGSRHGTSIEGKAVTDGDWTVVEFGTAIRAVDTVFTVVAVGEGATLRRADAFHFAYPGGRPARWPERPAEPSPPAPAASAPRRSLVPYVVPSVGAAALAASASGAPTALAFGATPVALGVGVLAERIVNRRQGRRAEATRVAARATAEDEHRAALIRFARAARVAAPDPATLAALLQHRGPRLWSMRSGEAAVRIGMRNDSGVLVPQLVAVGRAPLVVAGPNAGLDGLFAGLVLQLLASVSPSELDVVVISDDIDRWAWTAWTPHRTTAAVMPAEAVPADLPPRRAPARLLVLDRPRSSRWEGDPSIGEGDLVLWRSEREHEIPSTATIVVSAASATLLRVEDDDGVRDDVLADVHDDASALVFTGALALSRLLSRSGAAPAAGPVALTDVVPQLRDSAATVASWRRTAGPLRAAVGVGETGPLEVVLDGQNSHLLIAGTTGSGKTRLLESLVVSLAATRSPAELNVMIIDFKGGNELVSLARLPHCVGMVSDRNIAEVDRAISALTREIARRDELFASAGVSDLAQYVASAPAPLPRLVVVADEFGQFRRDDTLGDRVGALLRVAAQGRSKGIHLVLATQSPSTDVTAEIRQNVGTRMCLRVAEAGESVAVLGVPDAARLTGPGQVLVARDNELVSGQVALLQLPVGDDPRPVVVEELADAARGTPRAEVIQGPRLVDEVITTLAHAAAAAGAVAPVLLGPPLPDAVPRRALAHARRGWRAGGLVIGQRDRPGIAEPPPFCFDPAREAALLVVGGARSGRTTALLSLAEAAHDQSRAAARIAIHSIAWAPGLEVLAGSSGDAGVVQRGDFDHLRRTMAWLAEPGDDQTTRLVLIDRLDLLLRDLRELDGGALATRFLDVLHEGPRALAAAATVDPSGLLSGGAASLAGPRLVLPIGDPTLAAAVGLPRRTETIPGRAIAPNGDDVHIGLPSRAGAAPPAEPSLAAYVARMPSTVAGASLPRPGGERVTLGIGGAARLAPLVVDLDAVGPVIVVIGRPGSGRSAALSAFGDGYDGRRRVVRLESNGEGAWSPADSPSLLIVDDAARAAVTHPWLADDSFPDQLRQGGHVAVVAFEQADLTALGYRHWLIRRTYPGLLLALDPTPDRIVAGERVGFLPPNELRAGPAGRGWWCWRGAGVAVQVAAN